MKTIKNNIGSIFFGVLLLVLASCQKEYFDILENTGSTDLKMGFTTKTKILKALKYDPSPILLPRYNHSSLIFDDKMWILGGNIKDASNISDDVLFSTNGAQWNNLNEKANFPQRSLFGATVFQNKMWISGGLVKGSEFSNSIKNDVWSSEDGIEWNLVTPMAQFAKRADHTLTAFNGSLWLIGGLGHNAKTDTFETHSDIWRSSDGYNWVLVTDNAPFGKRKWHATIVYDNKIWLIGGGNNIYKSDVWYSDNGYQWILATDEAPFSTRGFHGLTTDGEQMWLTAGHLAEYGDENYFGRQNDIWRSTNGIDWFEVKTSQEFPKRAQHSSVFFDNKLWVINGSEYNDVWSFEY
ncbi:hypothetical protein J8L85_05360 [Maribacter sp. MMG018]|uniref:Kelch repeat-containing protein n=1 Tax=Maribacter sp. MMG018 TaxID=2822688 RepID=UPI001B377ECE|nr:hypothetical protein [Maribacter sp. MMG018]MBQ4913855.1 hypothetical protein [Maribacter sp. MMG018]